MEEWEKDTIMSAMEFKPIEIYWVNSLCSILPNDNIDDSLNWIITFYTIIYCFMVEYVDHMS